MNNRVKFGAIFGFLAMIWAHVANAGLITSVSMGNAPGGVAGGNCAAPAPNNDNVVGASPNTCIIDKRFDKLDYIDLVFTVMNSGGTTEYQFEESIFNATGRGWHDFHFDLGFGTGAAFVNSTNGDFLDFDEPAQDSPVASSHFARHMFDNVVDSLWFDDGKCFTNTFCDFTFAVDVPDHNDPGSIPAQYHIFDANGGVIGFQFTLRQMPSIPEPISILLFAFGLAALRYASKR